MISSEDNAHGGRGYMPYTFYRIRHYDVVLDS